MSPIFLTDALLYVASAYLRHTRASAGSGPGLYWGLTDGLSAILERLELRDDLSMPMRLRYSAISVA